MRARKPNPSDVSDGEWRFAGSYLTSMDEQVPQRPRLARIVPCLTLSGACRCPLAAAADQFPLRAVDTLGHL